MLFMTPVLARLIVALRGLACAFERAGRPSHLPPDTLNRTAANAALGREGGYDYSFVAHTGHLLQIEKPQDCVAVTMKFLDDCGLA